MDGRVSPNANQTGALLDTTERIVARISLRWDRKLSPGRQSQGKQALQARWNEAVWVGIAKMSNEHIVVLEDGGRAVRCRTIKRRPRDARWDGKTISGIVATPRKPNPNEPDEKEIGTSVTKKFEKPEPLTKPEARTEREVVRRNVRITNRILEKVATRQDALVARRRSPARPETGENTQIPAAGSRSRCSKTQMGKGGLSNGIRGARSSTSGAPEVLHAIGRDQKEETHDDELMKQDGGPADAGDGVPELFLEDVEFGVEADVEHDVQYGPEAGEPETTRLKSSVPEGNLEHEAGKWKEACERPSQQVKVHPGADVAEVAGMFRSKF